jgi:hypothetical protein
MGDNCFFLVRNVLNDLGNVSIGTRFFLCNLRVKRGYKGLLDENDGLLDANENGLLASLDEKKFMEELSNENGLLASLEDDEKNFMEGLSNGIA